MRRRRDGTMLLALFANLSATLALAAAPPDKAPLILESGRLRLQVAADTGAWSLTDGRQGAVWRSNPREQRFGQVTFAQDGKEQTTALGQFQSRRQADRIELEHALPGGAEPLRVVFRFAQPDVLQIACACRDPRVRRLRLLDDALAAGQEERGGVMIPVRMGMYVRPQSGKNFRHAFRTYEYEGCHCQCVVVRRANTAALVAWNNPDSVYLLESRGGDAAGKQTLLSSLDLTPAAAQVEIHVPERSDWATLAGRYREVARKAGWLIAWPEKLAELPGREALFGASNVKLWTCLARRLDEESKREESVRVHWTFDQAAQIAEHLRRDLDVDRALFILGGWTEGGYDCRHPDILPANPECGGNAALADCSRRVQKLGYTLGLHDNYQDMYRDAPSWGEDWLMKDRAGQVRKGGRWLGGRAYLTCSKPAVDLARRQQNLPEVNGLFHPGAYFIDTTTAVGLQECFDPRHPLTRADDLHWKQEISRFSRQTFGIFGSECGREWAIPCADFFEGLSGVSGKPYHNVELLPSVGGEVFPFFEMVYRDCIQVYGKYGYDIQQAAPYVLSHLLAGRPLHYHNLPQGLYWKSVAGQDSAAARPAVAHFEALGERRFRIRYRWSVEKPIDKDWRVLVHFTSAAGRILHGADFTPQPPTSQWKPGAVELGPFDVALPSQIKGPLEIRLGLFTPGDGPRAVLPGPHDGERRCRVGQLNLQGKKVAFEPLSEPAPAGNAGLYVQGDNGWTAGLHPQDRFLKNTHEILSPFNRRTSLTLMTDYGAMPDAPHVFRSQFAGGAEVYANLSSEEAAIRTPRWGETRLPPLGLLAHASDFLAICVRKFGGCEYGEPALFTLTSVDGQPLEKTTKIRVFHGFGPAELRIRGRQFHVPREATLDLPPQPAPAK